MQEENAFRLGCIGVCSIFFRSRTEIIARAPQFFAVVRHVFDLLLKLAVLFLDLPDLFLKAFDFVRRDAMGRLAGTGETAAPERILHLFFIFLKTHHGEIDAVLIAPDDRNIAGDIPLTFCRDQCVDSLHLRSGRHRSDENRCFFGSLIVHRNSEAFPGTQKFDLIFEFLDLGFVFGNALCFFDDAAGFIDGLVSFVDRDLKILSLDHFLARE